MSKIGTHRRKGETHPIITDRIPALTRFAWFSAGYCEQRLCRAMGIDLSVQWFLQGFRLYGAGWRGSESGFWGAQGVFEVGKAKF